MIAWRLFSDGDIVEIDIPDTLRGEVIYLGNLHNRGVGWGGRYHGDILDTDRTQKTVTVRFEKENGLQAFEYQVNALYNFDSETVELSFFLDDYHQQFIRPMPFVWMVYLFGTAGRFESYNTVIGGLTRITVKLPLDAWLSDAPPPPPKKLDIVGVLKPDIPSHSLGYIEDDGHSNVHW